MTVIELLSPSNKTGDEDRHDYLAKRRQVLAGHTHLVEIDFLRGGERPSPPDAPPCDLSGDAGPGPVCRRRDVGASSSFYGKKISDLDRVSLSLVAAAAAPQI